MPGGGGTGTADTFLGERRRATRGAVTTDLCPLSSKKLETLGPDSTGCLYRNQGRLFSISRLLLSLVTSPEYQPGGCSLPAMSCNHEQQMEGRGEGQPFSPSPAAQMYSCHTWPAVLWLAVPADAWLSLLSILQACFRAGCVVCSVCANYALDICSRTACVYNSTEVKEVN